MAHRRVVALVGISGVGKSTILAAAAKSLQFTHLQASALIKEEIRHRQSPELQQDQLRIGPIAHNQTLLIAAFHRLAPPSGLIVLDGHILIDSTMGIIEVEPEVFQALEIQHFVVLQAPPGSIFEQRRKDEQRKRPDRSVTELNHQQQWSTAAVNAAGSQIGVPVTILESDPATRIIELLRDEARKL